MGMLLCIPLILAGIGRPRLSRSRASRDAPKMADGHRTTGSEIRRLIGIAGPMPLAEYMRALPDASATRLLHQSRSARRGGDFTTSPEISQMFGELIGLWTAAVWRQMGEPENRARRRARPRTRHLDARRIARGEGRRRISYDAVVLASGRGQPGACDRHRSASFATLDVPILWHDKLEDVPGGPSIVIANEFIDALPVHQAVKQADGWHERVVDIAAGRQSCHRMAAPTRCRSSRRRCRAPLRHAPAGAIYEWRDDGLALELGRRMRSGGSRFDHRLWSRPLRIGRHAAGGRRHSFTDPLRAPGMADLTAHVDFEALAQCAESMGARIHGPVRQRDLFLRLGIEKRAAALKAGAPRQGRRHRDRVLAADRGGRARHGRIVQGYRHRGARTRRASRHLKIVMKMKLRHWRSPAFAMLSSRAPAAFPPGFMPASTAASARATRPRMSRKTAPAWRSALGVEPHRFLTAYQIHSPDVVMPKRRGRRRTGRAPTPS